MSARIRRHWFREGRERTAAEVASAAAAIVWKASVSGVQSLRKAGFSVEVGAGYLAVLREFLSFLLVAADRIAFRHDQGAWREAFTAALGRRLAAIYQENLDDLTGACSGGAHAQRFIELLNARMSEYAEFDYGGQGGDFGFQRYFGACVEEAVGDPQDRRWALDQVMSIQAPAAVEVLERGMRGLLGIDPKPGRRSAAGVTL